MMRWLLFVHVAGVAFWLGGIGALYVLFRKAASTAWDDGRGLAYDTAKSVVKGILNPSALLVLASGIAMIVQLGLAGRGKPFWLGFMEQFGGMVALVSAGLLTWQLRRIDRAASQEERERYWQHLNRTMAYIGVCVVATIFVVILRVNI